MTPGRLVLSKSAFFNFSKIGLAKSDKTGSESIRKQDAYYRINSEMLSNKCSISIKKLRPATGDIKSINDVVLSFLRFFVAMPISSFAQTHSPLIF